MPTSLLQRRVTTVSLATSSSLNNMQSSIFKSHGGTEPAGHDMDLPPPLCPPHDRKGKPIYPVTTNDSFAILLSRPHLASQPLVGEASSSAALLQWRSGRTSKTGGSTAEIFGGQQLQLGLLGGMSIPSVGFNLNLGEGAPGRCKGWVGL